MSELKQHYHSEGFLIQRKLIEQDTIKTFLHEETRLCREFGGKLTDWNNKPVVNGDKFKDMSEDELLSQVLAIHFPHKLSNVFYEALSHSNILSVLNEIVGQNVKCAQSMLFVKQAGKPGQAWHQDEFFIPTRDRSLVGVWIALDNATEENGCLRVLPGSHKPGVIYPNREHNNPEYDGAPESYDYPDDIDNELLVELDAGDVLFFNGYLLHSSRRNTAPRGNYRRSLVHHYLSAESLLPWNMGGLLPATEDNRDIVMVSGHDPYSWKGLENHNKPFIRTDSWT